ncbi:MAG: large conductance mechanosensitive channel protein MscL [Clostridia bacterium]|nr:large conductance mechanosensitive channel protein MscL [Clostridia bacterium]
MKKFFEEFKKFITRGNVVDMAVGVIVGSSFTAIVNGLSNYILKPIINWLLALIFGKNSLSEVFTFLTRVDKVQDVLDADGNVIGTEIVPDLTQSIYIDWGAFINAVINFFLIAFVLFTIVKVINSLRNGREALEDKIADGIPTKEERKEMKALGIKLGDAEAVAAYLAEKKRLAEEEAAKAAAEAEEQARIERENNPTTEDLLKQILEQMKK